VRPADDETAELTVIIVSYNTKVMTLKAIETLYAHTKTTVFKCVIFDNASSDGSAEAIRDAFPHVKVIASKENLGFAAANNLVANEANTPYLLLLNPDTETEAGAVDALMAFAQSRPQAGIWGGRTVFADGSLNVASCWAAPSLRSLFMRAFGLSTVFRQWRFFNPEGYGGWQRDSVQHVDIIVGCFLLVRRTVWNDLAGFREKYFMYGEDADLCLRAQKLGYHPLITPAAQIVHHVGASTPKNEDKAVLVMKARLALVKDHWPRWKIGPGLMLMWLWALLRYVVTRHDTFSSVPHARARADRWRTLWVRRHEWLAGYD
jgi:N-acetylglucosaminyl-diphospho-decaprenol L-rhamnosyltransferase